MTEPERESPLKELTALRERIRYLEEMEKEFAALARALKDSEARFRLLAEKILDGIFIVQDNAIKFVNPAMTDLMGYSAKEMGHRAVPDLIQPEDRERVFAEYGKLLAGAIQHRTLEFGAIRKDGNVFQVDACVVAISWEDRPAALCLIRDMTRQVQLESELRYAKKMDAVGTLAGGIAHDFNNHLQAISGYIQLLMMRGDRNSTDQDWLLQVARSVQRASNLTKQLLIFTRREEIRLEPLDLNEAVRQAQKTLARTIPESITAELRLAADPSFIDGDAVQLEHLLFNLGLNAKEAMPKGGKIIIETRNTHLNERFCRDHADVKPGAYVELSFMDAERGLDRKTPERVFEPVCTTQGAASWCELGLAIVYEIVQSHHGFILCESDREAGTTFRIYLPVQTRKMAAPAKEERKKGDYLGVETVLMVDDEPDILDIGQNILEQFGYSVLMARSGEEAIEIYSRHGARIDLVILDLGMPGMGGEKCLRELLRMNPSVKVIIASGYAATQTVHSILEEGAAGFMAKPYRLEDMLKKVRAVLDGKQSDDIPVED